MSPSTGIGVYPGSASLTENDEISSTHEGRHLTFLEADITGHEHTWPTKGHPVVVGEHIVGVILGITLAAGGVAGAAAEAVGDYISIDTEGIWALSVVATDDDGNVAVVAGDELYIHKTTAIISKNRNKNTHTHFGYALGGIAAGSTYVIAVKVHWDPADEEELVGQQGATAVMFTSARASNRFREYHYEATGGGYPHGIHVELNVDTVACNSAQALVAKLRWTADDNWVTGYGAVGEFELEVASGAGTMDTTCILHLTSNMTLTGTHTNNFAASFIWCHEYATAAGNQINNLISLTDQDAGDYPYAASTSRLFITLAGDVAATHAMKFLVNGTNYWFLCRNAIT